MEFGYEYYQGSGRYTALLEGDGYEYEVDIDMVWVKDLEYRARQEKEKFEQNNHIPEASSQVSRIDDEISLQRAQETYLNERAKVLLYELTVNYGSYDISCDGGCMVDGDDLLAKEVDSLEVSIQNT